MEKNFPMVESSRWIQHACPRGVGGRCYDPRGMAKLEEIIAAAAKVFQTKGYHAATVQDIA